MAYELTVISRAKARLQQARQEHEAEQQARREEIYRKQPRLKEIDHTLRATTAKVMAVAFQHGEDPTQAIENLRRENLSLQREREWLLDEMGLEPDSLEETPFCAACGGTGYVGAVMCECLKELCRQEQRRELSYLLNAGPDRFEAFRLDLYSSQPDPKYAKYSAAVSPRDNMSLILADCRAYAQSFSLASPSLLFAGAPGLGKTFLSACIARKAAEGGWSVIYDTAVNVFAEFEAAKFGSAAEENRGRTGKYLACDLLILDDLGTEMTTQFIISALYTLVNTRLMNGHPTIISTNLDIGDIRQRYSPQIQSRLLGAYQYYCFYGEDIRLKLRSM